MPYGQGEEPVHAGGLLEAVKRLLASFSDIFRTRLEILSIELQEEGSRLGQMFFLGVMAVFLLMLGVLLCTLFFVVLFWETHRLQVIGGFAVFYLLAAALAVFVLRRRRKTPGLFPTTLSELRKDCQRLSPRQ